MKHFLDLNRGRIGANTRQEQDLRFMGVEEAAEVYGDHSDCRDPLDILIALEELEAE